MMMDIPLLVSKLNNVKLTTNLVLFLKIAVRNAARKSKFKTYKI